MMAGLSVFALLLAVYFVLADAALYGRNATIIAGSGTISTASAATFSSVSSIFLPSSSSRISLTSFPTSFSWTNTSLGLPSGISLTATILTSSISSPISSSRVSPWMSVTSNSLGLTTSDSTDTTMAVTLENGLTVTSSTPSTFLVSTSDTTAIWSSPASESSIGSSNSTSIGVDIGASETALTSSSSSGSITATSSSSSAFGTSTITSPTTSSGTATISAISTPTGYPVTSNGQCKGPDCDNGACTGILCVSLGCSGPGCSNGICTGSDCISLGCIGTGCSSGVCTESGCVTSGCKGSDCNVITGECSGSDCISVGCSGSDCDSSTGSCSGPNCSTETCRGSDCDKGSCQGPNCDDEGSQTGGGTGAPTNNPTSQTSNPTSTTISSSSPSSSSSCTAQTASLCAAACMVTAVPDPSNTTNILSTSCYSTTCSVTAGCSIMGMTTSSSTRTTTNMTTSMLTSSRACMTVMPFSDITSSGSVVTTTYTATAVVYTITDSTANTTSSSSTGTGLNSTIASSATITNSSSYTSLTSSTAMTSSSSSITSASATTISCIYQGADPDQGKDAYCICSSSTFSILTGASGILCAYATIPTSSAVVTQSPLYTTTENCFACTIYGESNENCVQISGCAPTSTVIDATNTASTTTTSVRVTCTAWTQCPTCPAGQSQVCGGLAGQESCGCSTDSNFENRRDWSVGQSSWPEIEDKHDDFLYKRASDNGDILCPYQPRAEDTYCIDSGLSKRANNVKELNLPWASGIKFSNYPACPQTGEKGIEKVPKFYYPAGAALPNNKTQSYDPTLAKGRSRKDFVNGIPQAHFANDHIFEAQLVSGFLSWLCGQPSIKGYAQIPWPRDWTQPDTQWCKAVFGSESDAATGYLFPAYNGDTTPNNFLGNCAEVIGGLNKPTLMAVYYGPSNGWKGKITKAQWPKFEKQKGAKGFALILLQEAAAITIRDFVNVFSYFTDAKIESGWITPSKSIETICVQFVNTFWGSTNAITAPGTKLVRPLRPQGITNWGLRTLWAYWIDNHLNNIEQRVPGWCKDALAMVGGTNSPFARAYMQPGGLATSDQMHFPRDVSCADPMPGTQGSAASACSKYMMWDGTAYGKLGL